MRKLLLPLLPHLTVQLHDELPQHHGAHVVGEDVEETPVTKLKPVGDVVKNVADPLLENMRRLKRFGLHYL